MTLATIVVDPFTIAARAATQDPSVASLDRSNLRPRIPLEWWWGVGSGVVLTPANTPVGPIDVVPERKCTCGC